MVHGGRIFPKHRISPDQIFFKISFEAATRHAGENLKESVLIHNDNRYCIPAIHSDRDGTRDGAARYRLLKILSFLSCKASGMSHVSGSLRRLPDTSRGGGLCARVRLISGERCQQNRMAGL